MAQTNGVCSTAKIKALADVRPVTIDDADSIIRAGHLGHSQDADVRPVKGAKDIAPAPVQNPPAAVESLPAAPVESLPLAPAGSQVVASS